MAPHPKLSISGLNKSFRNGPVKVLSDINLEVADNEFVTLVGASGCGKSTLLGIIAGLQESDNGDVLVDGVSISGPGIDRGVVFQSYTLLPWLTAQQNVEFALRETRHDPKEITDIARRHIELVKLTRFADSFPSQLSGGMKQRVAIARALSYRPKILLMDEPFGALDALTRSQMQELLMQIWQEHKLTVIFVTHDVSEAVYLSDRILVMGLNPGRIKETVAVPFTRPRASGEGHDPELLELHARVLRSIREETVGHDVH
ncbi:ABC transporter ATP-binding protein [Mesorhizobium sp. BR1-1-9]|uniref:ABC transporter ATP-binding protein n=1 Tax=Mesorhizobium sp. BR1-1-9 TaxID=2876646 RepID=UPI001CD167E3|nr:ABC transporter ATP-binding protein [Mesorhizobium sp. BR1-1-9]MBZ9870497.1 ABC transporter ATP-binding protein [Mesorhizobium sp. BR1-1-9]